MKKVQALGRHLFARKEALIFGIIASLGIIVWLIPQWLIVTIICIAAITYICPIKKALLYAVFFIVCFLIPIIVILYH